MSLKLNWIDTEFVGVRRIYDNGSELPERPAINMVGTTIIDDPVNNWTTITLSDPIVGAATPNAIPDTLALRNGGAGCNFTTLGCTTLNASIAVNTVDLNVSGILSVIDLTASGTITGSDVQTTTLEVSGLTTLSDLNCNNLNVAGDVDVIGVSHFTDTVTCDNYLITENIQINNAQVTFKETNSSPGLYHNARTTNTTPANIIITPQIPFASATGSNRKPGDLVLNNAPPAGGLSGFANEGKFIIKKNGVSKLLFGQDTSNYRIEVQTDLIFQTLDQALASGFIAIKTGSTTTNSNPSGALVFLTGDVQGLSSLSGSFLGGSGGSTQSNSGTVTLKSGDVSVSGNSGAVTVKSGTTLSGSSGAISIFSSNVTSGTTGNVSITTGNTPGTTGNISLATGINGSTSGSVTIQSGNSASNPGDVSLFSGAASVGDGGNIFLTSGGTNTGIGGSIFFTTGNSNTSGSAGSFQVNGGNAQSVGNAGGATFLLGFSAGAGHGGDFTVTCGNSVTGRGGNVILEAGAGTSGGSTSGKVSIISGGANGSRTGTISLFQGSTGVKNNVYIGIDGSTLTNVQVAKFGQNNLVIGNNVIVPGGIDDTGSVVIFSKNGLLWGYHGATGVSGQLF